MEKQVQFVYCNRCGEIVPENWPCGCGRRAKARKVNTMSDRYVYSYYRVNVPEKTRGCREGGIGFVCMRIDRPAKSMLSGPGPFNYTVSFSFCSPRDNFSRPEAHSYTDKRAADPNQIIKIKSKHPLPMRAIAWRGFVLALSNKNPNIKIPSWLSASFLANVQPYSRGQK